MKPFSLLCAIAMLLATMLPIKASAVIPALKVTEMTVTTRIFKGEPIDSVMRVSSGAFKGLYCFTRVESPGNENTSIKHVWYLNGEVAGEFTLPVKGDHWRTYSKKFIEEGSSGAWRVDALDSEGNLLKSVKFTLN
jgi:hypothetical protein